MFAQLVESLGGKSAKLFLAAGGLLIVFAGLLGVEAISDQAMPEDIFGPPGYAIAALGLLGLYMPLAEQAPRLMRVAGIAAGLTTIGWALITVTSIAEEIGLMRPLEDVGAPGILLVSLTGVVMLVSYVLFSVASLRTGVLPTSAGILLLVPPATFFANLAVLAPLISSDAVGAFIAGSVQALAHVAIGIALNETAVAPERRRAAGEYERGTPAESG